MTQSSVSQQMVAKRVDLWQQIGGGITYGCLGLSSTLPAVSALPCCCGIAYPTKHLRLQHSLRCCHNILTRHGGGKLYACHNRTLQQSCAVQIKTVHARCQDALSYLHSFDVYSSPLQRSVYRHRGTPQTGADIECVDTGPVWLIVDTMEMNGQQAAWRRTPFLYPLCDTAECATAAETAHQNVMLVGAPSPSVLFRSLSTVLPAIIRKWRKRNRKK